MTAARMSCGSMRAAGTDRHFGAGCERQAGLRVQHGRHRYTRLQTDLEAGRVLAVIGHPQSTYVRRVQRPTARLPTLPCAAVRTTAARCLLWHTGAAFAKIRALVQNLLDGYDAETTGTVLLSDGNRVTASILSSSVRIPRKIICSAASARAAMPTGWSMPDAGTDQYYGMYSHGRNFYYIYVPDCSTRTRRSI